MSLETRRPGGRNVEQHEGKMAEGAQDDEDVPDLVEAENARKWIGLLEDVDDGSDGVEQPSQHEPGERTRRYVRENFAKACDGKPAHQEVKTRREPTGRADDDELHEDAEQGERPDDGEEAEAPEAGEVVQADGGVGAGDEQVDGGMVELAQKEGDPGSGVQQVVEGAEGEHQDQSEAVDGKGSEFGGIALREVHKNKQPNGGEEGSTEMG